MLKTTKNKIIVLAAVFLTALIVGIAAHVSRKGDVIDALPDEQLTDGYAVTEPPDTDVTTTPTTTAKPKAESKNETAETTETTETTAEDITLAPVDVPEQDVLEILEENDIEITTTAPKPQTTPATEPDGPKPGDTKIIDGKKHIWHPDFGWVDASREGTVIVMDVEDDGRRYEGW